MKPNELIYFIIWFVWWAMLYSMIKWTVSETMECTPSQEHQETITALADIRQSIEVLNDSMKK